MRSLWVLGCRCQERNTQMRYRIYIRSALWEATEGRSSWKCCGGVAIPKVSMVYWKLPLSYEFLTEQPRSRVPTTKMEWRMVQWSTAKWGSIWCQRAYRTPSFAEILGRLSLIVKLVSFSLMSSRDSFWYPDIHDTLWICMHASPFWPWMYLDVHGYRWQNTQLQILPKFTIRQSWSYRDKTANRNNHFLYYDMFIRVVARLPGKTEHIKLSGTHLKNKLTHNGIWNLGVGNIQAICISTTDAKSPKVDSLLLSELKLISWYLVC